MTAGHSGGEGQRGGKSRRGKRQKEGGLALKPNITVQAGSGVGNAMALFGSSHFRKRQITRIETEC